MKRDLFKDGFTAEDFMVGQLSNAAGWPQCAGDMIAFRANAILREALDEAQTATIRDTSDTLKFIRDEATTHTAKLVAITKIKPE